MRCKACDQLMTERELQYTDRKTGEHLDLYTFCRVESDTAVSEQEYNYLNPVEVMSTEV